MFEFFKLQMVKVKSKPFSMTDTFIPDTQHHGCWYLGDAMSQGISSHGIGLVLHQYSSFRSVKVCPWHIRSLFPLGSPAGCATGIGRSLWPSAWSPNTMRDDTFRRVDFYRLTSVDTLCHIRFCVATASNIAVRAITASRYVAIWTIFKNLA